MVPCLWPPQGHNFNLKSPTVTSVSKQNHNEQQDLLREGAPHAYKLSPTQQKDHILLAPQNWHHPQALHEGEEAELVSSHS